MPPSRATRGGERAVKIARLPSSGERAAPQIPFRWMPTLLYPSRLPLLAVYSPNRRAMDPKAGKWRWLVLAVTLGLSCSTFSIAGQNKAAESLKEVRTRADQGVAEAQFNLGSMYEHGEGVTQDYAEAARWYRKSGRPGSRRSTDHSRQHVRARPGSDARLRRSGPLVPQGRRPGSRFRAG